LITKSNNMDQFNKFSLFLSLFVELGNIFSLIFLKNKVFKKFP